MTQEEILQYSKRCAEFLGAEHPQQSHYFIKEATMDLSELQWTSIHENKSRKP